MKNYKITAKALLQKRISQYLESNKRAEYARSAEERSACLEDAITAKKSIDGWLKALHEMEIIVKKIAQRAYDNDDLDYRLIEQLTLKYMRYQEQLRLSPSEALEFSGIHFRGAEEQKAIDWMGRKDKDI